MLIFLAGTFDEIGGEPMLISKPFDWFHGKVWQNAFSS